MRRLEWAAAAGAMVSGGVLAVLVAEPSALAPQLTEPTRTVWLIGGAWLAFAVAAFLVCLSPVRVAVALILVGGLALQLAAGFGPPRGSDDVYRYIWDGRVQAAGINPYRFPPAATELAGLRDDFLWPERSNWCVAGEAPGCTLINRPTVHTIYPPVAQAFFRTVDELSPAGARQLPMQLAATAIALATTLLLLLGLRTVGGDPRRAVLWAWCPAVAYEAGSNAHVDVLATFLTGAALICLARAKTRQASAAGGVLLGLAIATKLTPVLALPAVIRRRPIAVIAATAGTVALGYLPHVLAVGAGVLGYVPGYLAEEGYANGSRFALLSWFLPQSSAAPAAVAILCTVAVLVVRAADPDRPWIGAAAMTGAALLVAAPSYPWYALMLVLMVALGARPEWLVVAAAGYLAQYAPGVGIADATAQRIGYGTALVVLVVATLARRLRKPHNRGEILDDLCCRDNRDHSRSRDNSTGYCREVSDV